jgi:hypothetical protein
MKNENDRPYAQTDDRSHPRETIARITGLTIAQLQEMVGDRSSLI